MWKTGLERVKTGACGTTRAETQYVVFTAKVRHHSVDLTLEDLKELTETLYQFPLK
jgi:hypothetical protein